jgi:hypothetical protein
MKPHMLRFAFELLILTKRERQVLLNCRTMEAVAKKLLAGFGSTAEALHALRRLELAVLAPGEGNLQRELIMNYPNLEAAFRSWHDLQLSEFETRRFPLTLVLQYLRGIEVALRRVHPKSDEDVLLTLFQLEQSKIGILATALVGENETPPLHTLANLTLAIQLAKIASTTISARPEWLPEAWRIRNRDTYLAAAKYLWQESRNPLALAPHFGTRLKLFFLVTLRWEYEYQLRRGAFGRASNRLRPSILKWLDWAFDEIMRLMTQFGGGHLIPNSQLDIQMIVRQQRVRLSRISPELRGAIMNTKSNDRSLDISNTCHLEPKDADRPGTVRPEIETI